MSKVFSCSTSGLGERLWYFHVELNLVLFLPFPRMEPSSSANGSYSLSNREPYDILARLVNAGEDHSSPSFVPRLGRFEMLSVVYGDAYGDVAASGDGIRSWVGASGSAAGWSISIRFVS